MENYKNKEKECEMEIKKIYEQIKASNQEELEEKVLIK